MAQNTIPGYNPNAVDVTSISPTSGPAGTTVTIFGSNFGGTQGSSTVDFNGAGATVVSWGPSQIVVTVPQDATTGYIVVTVSGYWSAYYFTVAQNIGTGPSAPASDIRSSVTPNARVLFLAMCGITNPYLAFWNIPSGHVLIYPISTRSDMQVFLWTAAGDLQVMLEQLARGRSAAAAIDQGNASAQDPKENAPWTWKSVGDSNVQFQKVP
jgi:hypothetical protein